jgi:type VI secretion system protein ImpJ
MKLLSKVVWTEGMYLGPHHFQSQNRYFENLAQFDSSMLWFEPYGFIGYALDAEALQNGTVALLHARGIFPDGLPFHMPECDPLPSPLEIAGLFPPTSATLEISLAIPAYKSGEGNCSLSGADGCTRTRYIAVERSVADENTGRDEKNILLGRKNVQIRLETGPAEGLTVLPMARVMRDGSGQFIYDPNFIAPCTQISASESLMKMAKRLIDILEEKSAALSAGRRSPGKFATELSPQEVETFWFLHSINSALSSLRHLYFAKRGHPEELYVELARLGGALCTFGVGSLPQNLPLYDHWNLQLCFLELERHIREHLEMLAPTNCVAIPLKPVAHYIYGAEVTDARCMDRSRWILGVHSDIGEVEVIARTRQLVKICSAQHIQELVKRGLQGLTLTHLPAPPAAVSPKVENQYFSINKAGPCWEFILKTRRVGVYVPGDLPNPELELLVVLEGA